MFNQQKYINSFIKDNYRTIKLRIRNDDKLLINKINKKAAKQKNNPSTEEKISGVVENAVIPSKAYFVNFQKDHFVSPATLCIFSYSSHFVLKPTKLKRPFE